MTIEKPCRRCQKPFSDGVECGFVTCPDCRIPIKNIYGGCRRWEEVATGPRVLVHDDLTIRKAMIGKH